MQLLTTTFVIQSDAQALYYISFLLTILFSLVMEDELIYFYTQIIPANFELMKIKGLTVFFIMRYLGSICGGISSLFGFSLYKKDGEVNYEEILIIIQNSFTLFVQFLLFVIFLINSDRFSDRPIRRIVYSKNVREIRRTEF